MEYIMDVTISYATCMQVIPIPKILRSKDITLPMHAT